MTLTLHAQWRIAGDALPERLLPSNETKQAFSLPGAEDLSAFADLLGFTADEQESAQQPEHRDALFSLPAMIPDDAPGEIVLSREIDFSGLSARRAILSFDMLCGRGRVSLSPCTPRFPRPGMPDIPMPAIVAAFDHAPLTLDVSQALYAGSRFLLTLHFDADRPAGVCGAVLLRTPGVAMLKNVFIRPDPVLRTMTIQADALSTRNGGFLLRAQLCPAHAPASPEAVPLIREVPLRLTAQESQTVSLCMEANCPRFEPGIPYEAPAMKIQLFEKTPSHTAGVLCDSVTLMCGFPGEAAQSVLPLQRSDCRRSPDELIAQLKAMHVQAVSLPAAGTDLLYRQLTRAGIGVRQTAKTPDDAKNRLRRYPCVTFDDLHVPKDAACDPILSAWQLCGLTAYARTPDPGMTPAELLREIAGCALNPADHADVLAWLRAVSIRLRAEAIRQGRLTGAYCEEGEWRDPDIAQAIGTALAPMHLSALPLCGAWWTGSRFSASLYAFIPRNVHNCDASLRAEALLEDAQGNALAAVCLPCPAQGGPLGLIEAQLPEHACVLELTTRLYADDTLVEESVLPVYVGDRGPLEAAFRLSTEN